MLSSTRGNKSKCCLHRVSSISSSCSSCSKQYSTFRPTLRSMEEVWKDINLASLPDNSSLSETPPMRLYHPHPTSTTNNFRSTILQDFLARPFGNDPHHHHPHPPINVVSTSSIHDTTNTLYGPTATDSSSLPPPATALSLNSGPDFHFLDNSDPLPPHDSHLQSDPISNVTSFSCPFEALASSSGLPSFGKKRFPESGSGSGAGPLAGAGGDRRHNRMIKNRESAARSRARKQAYTNELELEVAHLMEENAKLRRQQEQICRAAAAQVPKKHTLRRTSTAPF